MKTIRIRRHDTDVEDVIPATDDRDTLRFFFILHNAVHVSDDPVPLVYSLGDGSSGFVYPQDIASLRLFDDGEDVTQETLAES